MRHIPTRTKAFLSGLFLIAALAAGARFAPTGQAPAAAPEFTATQVMIPMRDGVKLNTVIFTPKKAVPPLPFLLMRTPYGVPESPRPLMSEPYEELVAEGYIFVFQDIRGRYKSEGTFVMQRPPRDRRDPRAIDESTDAYDTVAWLLQNVPGHNGRVGLMGISYGGWLTAMAMLDPHPAVKAVSPQASPADMYLGDDFHHNGAFRLSYGFEYATRMETTKEQTSFQFDRYDTYEWYLRLGPLAAVNEKYLLGKIPTWNDYVAHPNYDAFWQKQAMASYLTRVTVPALHVAGWWDQEDFYGPQKIYETLEPLDRDKISFFVAGPWFHGGWMRSDGSSLGRIKFGANTSKYFREKIQAPFFAHFLKDKGRWDVTEAVTFETGANAWQVYDEWPPRNLTEDRGLYFREDGGLSFEAPSAGDERAFDSYVSDPAHPVPYRPRPVEATYDPRGSGWRTWLVGDQRSSTCGRTS
jgi:putative CocE/NonD family hydrolase